MLDVLDRMDKEDEETDMTGYTPHESQVGRWVCATEEMVVLVYAVICMYMESDPNLCNPGTATATATEVKLTGVAA